MDNKLKIINYLGKHNRESFTMLELSKLIKIPYATFYRVINCMQDLLQVKSVGKAKTIALNTNNSAVKHYLIISSEEERKEFLAKQQVLRVIYSELKTTDTVLLFGSYAKGTYREHSDIDLMIINQKGQKSLSFSSYEFLFMKKIHPIFFAKQEFLQMLREKEENVGLQALKGHIVLNNPEQFWTYVLNGRIQRTV